MPFDSLNLARHSLGACSKNVLWIMILRICLSWMAARSSYLKGKHPLLSGLKPLNNMSQHTSASLLSGLVIDHNRHVHIGVWRGVHTSLSTTCVMWWFQMRGGSMCERERNLWQNVQQGEKEMFWKVTQHKIRPWGCLYTFCYTLLCSEKQEKGRQHCLSTFKTHNLL